MADFKQECKICDKIIIDKKFKVIEDVAKDIFDFLLLKLTLMDTQNVICTTCYSKLIAALNFKTKCLYTDNTIIPYVDFNNSKPDLKQIYAKEKGSKQGASMLEDREVCRLCLQPTFGHKSIQEVPVGSIDIYIPEINFEATTNPVICIKCFNALHVHSTFIKNWADLDKRNGDSENCREIFLENQSIKTEKIEFKPEETVGEILLETLCNIKTEEQDEGGTFIKNCLDVDKKRNGNAMNDEEIFLNDQSIKTEETLFEILCDINKEVHNEGDTSLQSLTDLKHTDESKSLYELDHPKQTNNQSEECSFKTTSESRSEDYEGRHKRASEAQANKSDCNNQNSKRRCPTRGLKVQEYQLDKCTYNTKRKDSFMQHQIILKDSAEMKMFECDKCTYETKHRKSVINHCLTHKDPAEVRMFECDECDYKSIRKGNLLKHQLTHKDPAEVKMFNCDKCTFETKHKNNLIQHSLTHKDPSEVRAFECDECDYKSIRKRDLRRHQLRHKDPSEVKMFKCDKCTFETKFKGNLKKHCLSHNGDAMSSQEIFLNDNESIKTEGIEIKCEETDEDIIFEIFCDINKEEHNEGDTSLQSQTVLMHTEETSAQATFPNNQSEECSFKNKSGSRSAGQERQHKRASEAQANKSDESNRNSERQSLTRVLKVQDYQCDKCTYNTKRKNSFMQHHLIHKDPSEVRMYECDECQYRSIQKTNLKRHQLTHQDPSEVKMFKCDKCTFQTKHKSTLVKHCLTHKDPAEVRMFKCDECDYKSIRKGNILKHQLGHKDPAEVKMFNCDKCTFETKHKNNLIQHCLRHQDPAEVQVFECDECDYKSMRKRDLKRHQLRHKDPSEVNMFKCDKCTFETKFKVILKKHCLTHRDPSEVQKLS